MTARTGFPSDQIVVDREIAVADGADAGLANQLCMVQRECQADVQQLVEGSCKGDCRRIFTLKLIGEEDLESAKGYQIARLEPSSPTYFPKDRRSDGTCYTGTLMALHEPFTRVEATLARRFQEIPDTAVIVVPWQAQPNVSQNPRMEHNLPAAILRPPQTDM